jgi:hypothetical protein
VYLNLEDHKDITFPNIVIHVLVHLFKSLDDKIRSNIFLWRFRPKVHGVRKRLRNVVASLELYIHEPDSETQEVGTTEQYEQQAKVTIKAPSVAGDGGASRNTSRQVSRSLPRDKIDYLRLELTTYKNLIVDISRLFGDRSIFLVMDDLYFVAKGTQPSLIDYFHRLTKDTDLFLKIATIKHRSKVYRRTSTQHTGVELGHDVFEIDMDYSLDNFEELTCSPKTDPATMRVRTPERGRNRRTLDEQETHPRTDHPQAAPGGRKAGCRGRNSRGCKAARHQRGDLPPLEESLTAG